MITRTPKLNTAAKYLAVAVVAAGLSASGKALHAQSTPSITTADSRPLVTVGSQTISRGEYYADLESLVGKQVLNKLVYTALIRQAATKANLMPTDADVDARITDLQRRSPQVAAQAQDPVIGPAFREDLKTDLALENLRIQGVTVSDAETKVFYAINRALFTLPAQAQTTMVLSQTAGDAHSALLDLKEGMEPAVIAEKPGLRVAGVNGFNVNMDALPPAVRQQISQTVLVMRPGQIKTLPIPNPPQTPFFLTFKVKSAVPASLPPLSQIKDQVVRAAKLQKAVTPQQELTTLYAANPPTFSDPRYQAFFGAAGSSHP